MRNFALLAFFFMFALPMLSAYTDHSLTVQMVIKSDGTAHVTERTIVYMDTQEEVDAFKNNLRLGKTTIVDWKKFSDNIRYHIGGPSSIAENLSITAGPEYSLGDRARAITLDYDMVTPITNITKIGSRTSRYWLRDEMLGFELNDNKQTILGSNVEFSILMPSGASIMKNDGISQVGPSPYKYDPATQTVTWSGPMTGKWILAFEIEEPLSNEVYEFFSTTYQQILALAPLALLLISAGVVLTLLVRMPRA